MNLANIIALAYSHKHRGTMRTSAEFCYEHAVKLELELPGAARMWALKSLTHSIGILHPDHQLAEAELVEVYNSETGEVLGETINGVSYEEACAIMGDWNHSGAPMLFRARAFTGHKSNPPFSCGEN